MQETSLETVKDQFTSSFEVTRVEQTAHKIQALCSFMSDA